MTEPIGEDHHEENADERCLYIELCELQWIWEALETDLAYPRFWEYEDDEPEAEGCHTSEQPQSLSKVQKMTILQVGGYIVNSKYLGQLLRESGTDNETLEKLRFPHRSLSFDWERNAWRKGNNVKYRCRRNNLKPPDQCLGIILNRRKWAGRKIWARLTFGGETIGLLF